MKTLIYIYLILALLPCTLKSQPVQEPEVDKARLNRFLLITGAGYTVTQVGLYSLWYKDQQSQSFQFFDDSRQWKQIDKAGHFYTAFQLSQISTHAFHHAGMAERRSYWHGALMGSLMLLPIEIFDGYSEAYGFSWSDVAANTMGAVFLPIQYELWNEVRVRPKFSFHRTDFPKLRPNTLGKRWYEEIIKDYNGQTYWLSFDLYRFFPNSAIPKWMNLAIGYGADNMVYAREYENEAYGLKASRQYYLSLDIDLSHFRKPPSSLGNKLLNGALYVANLIHLPAPALSYQEGRGFRFYPLYF